MNPLRKYRVLQAITLAKGHAHHDAIGQVTHADIVKLAKNFGKDQEIKAAEINKALNMTLGELLHIRNSPENPVHTTFMADPAPENIQNEAEAPEPPEIPDRE